MTAEDVVPLNSGLPVAPRIGIGVDVHPFGDDRTLALACLTWPGEIGLAGHSDGDVVAHAACDALLSAAGLGDLGAQFGTSDPQWAGASGADLLAETARRVAAEGWAIGNVAVQLIGERPKINERRQAAELAMSRAVGAPVSLAGTTTDGLGLTGRGEGLAAIATALVIQR
jgi:2-C-methyl-D-erythritol 2,4-cyclodiphosphate synthase